VPRNLGTLKRVKHKHEEPEARQPTCMCYMTKQLKQKKEKEIIETARGPPKTNPD